MTNNRIVQSSKVAQGAPIIRGTHIPIHEILARLATGATPDQVVNQLSGLELADVSAALEYAAASFVRKKQDTAPLETELFDADEMLNDKTIELSMKKILIVDDIEDNRILMKHMFKGSRFELIMAHDGREGLKLAQTELPILIISDIQMPGMSGLDLVTALKSNELTKGIGIILVTAHARGPSRTSVGLAMGADDYIPRPFIKTEFLARVGSVMRLKWSEETTRRKAKAVAQHNTGLELVNELAIAVNSSLNLQEIFGASMLRLSQLLDAEAVSVLVLSESKQKLEVNISSYTGQRVSIPIDFTLKADITAQEVEEKVPGIITNVLINSHHDLGMASVPDASTIQCIPLISKEQVIGAIAIINKQSAFADIDWILLHSAAGIIAVAVENARLLKTAQDQVDDLIVLNEIGRALTSTLNQDQILKQTTLLAQRSLQAEATSLWVLDETEQELELITSSGIRAAVKTDYQELASYVARTGEPYVSADISKDEKFFNLTTNLDDYIPRSILSVPVRAKGQIIGIMQALHRDIGWFDENHVRLFHSVASSVGIAVNNAQLFSEVQDFNHQLEQMVTERTNELTKETEKTEAILASMADGLLVLDAKNCILTANSVAEKMLDFNLSQMVSQPIGPEQLSSSLWNRINTMANSAKLTDSAVVDMFVPQTKEFRSIQARSAKVHHKENEIIGTVIVLHDITAIKEVERMKAAFMAGVTHELKTPLAIIRLHSKNLTKYYQRLPEQKRNELLNSIQTQVELLARLIDDILQISRLDSGIVETQHKQLDLNNLVEQVLLDIRPLAEAKQIMLKFTKSTKQPITQGNSAQLERVIRNLIDNAIKYTPSGGSIQVQTGWELKDNQQFVGVQIADTGIGIPPEHQSKIFDRFHRVDPSHTIPGTGLGLSIVKEIVSAHSGDIRLESKPEQGTVFMIILPYIET